MSKKGTRERKNPALSELSPGDCEYNDSPQLRGVASQRSHRPSMVGRCVPKQNSTIMIGFMSRVWITSECESNHSGDSSGMINSVEACHGGCTLHNPRRAQGGVRNLRRFWHSSPDTAGARFLPVHSGLEESKRRAPAHGRVTLSPLFEVRHAEAGYHRRRQNVD